jgi:cytochrome P450
MEKDPFHALFLDPKKGYVMSLAPREIHSRQRRAFAHLFTQTTLLQEEGIIKNFVKELTSAFQRMIDEQGGTAKVDATEWFRFYAFDTIGSLAFGKSFDSMGNGRDTEWTRSISAGLAKGGYDQAARRVVGTKSSLRPTMEKLFLPKDIATRYMVHFQKSTAALNKRLDTVDSDHKDFVYHILRNNEAKGLLSTSEIKQNLMSIVNGQ